MPIRLAEADANTYRYPLLIRHLLHRPMRTALEQYIVYKSRVRYRYADLHARLGRLANALVAVGVEPGETVAVMDWDSHRYLECFFAVPMMGAVLQTVNIRLSPGQILYTLQHAKARTLLVHRDFMPLVEELRARLGPLRAVIGIDESDANGPWPDWVSSEYEASLGRAPEHHEFADFDENAVATTFYTTGTTGSPKGVEFSHRQIVLHTLALAAACCSGAYGQSVRGNDVYMPMTPMFHVHAWGNPYLATLLGLKQVYPGRYVAEELLALKEREGVTYSHCVPAILQMLLQAAETSKADLSGWKICIGGSALPTGLALAALRRGVDVYAGYGMSETGPVMTITRLTEPPLDPAGESELRQRCRAGVPIPLVDLQIVDDSMRTQPQDGNASGEIVVRAPWTTVGYVGDAEASANLWRGGYLHTQDVGTLDRSGSLQITDRLKDVIKSGGEWISSLDLESIISSHPGVAEVAVIGAKDARWGERPHALIVPRSEFKEQLTREAIQTHVAQAVAAGRIPSYAVPELVTFVSALDKTSVGKLNKKLLREKYGGQ